MAAFGLTGRWAWGVQIPTPVTGVNDGGSLAGKESASIPSSLASRVRLSLSFMIHPFGAVDAGYWSAGGTRLFEFHGNRDVAFEDSVGSPG